MEGNNPKKQELSKGCLALLAGIFVCGGIMAIGSWIDCTFIRNLGIMMGGLVGAFVGNWYFNTDKKKKASVK